MSVTVQELVAEQTWPAGDGEMVRRYRRHDWVATPLGPIRTWPQSLRTAVDMILAMPGPATILWGPAHVQLYNDAYVAIAQHRHPELLGLPVADGWPEVYDAVIAPLLQASGAGKATRLTDFPVTLYDAQRRPEERLFDTDWSPIRDEAGEVAGALQTLVEVTERRRADAALRESEERQAFLLALSDALRPIRDPADIQRTATRMLGEQLRASRVFYVTVAPDGDTADIVGDYTNGVPSRIGRYSLKAFSTYAVGEWRNGRTALTDDVDADPRYNASERAAYVSVSTRAGFGVPLIKEGRLEAILGVNQTSPRHWTGGDLHLVEEVAERTWAAVERARAEAELRDAERFSRALVEGVPQLVWRAVDGGHWTWASPQWSHLTGQAEADSHGYGWLDPVHPDDRERVKVVWAGAVESGEFHADYRLCDATEHRYRWFQTRATPVCDDAGEIVEWLGTSTDVQDLCSLQERQRVLLHELQHRVRNTLAVVRSLSKSTAQTSESVADFAANFEGRLNALARTQMVLTRSPGAGVDLRALVKEEVLAQATTSEQVGMEGPDIVLSAKAAEVLALAVHELATNAVKYGALSQPQGLVRVSWSTHEEDGERWLEIKWSESSLHVQAPEHPRQGFGTELVTMRVPYELRGRGHLELRPEGMRAEIAFPLAAGESILQTDAPEG